VAQTLSNLVSVSGQTNYALILSMLNLVELSWIIIMTNQQPSPSEKEVTNSYEALQSQGEDLGYQVTPESLNTQPTPVDLLQASEAYAQAALGEGSQLSNFQQVNSKPETWQAQIVNGSQTGVLTAKRVPGGYDLKVHSDGVQGIYD
jgi:hypothetical protein